MPELDWLTDILPDRDKFPDTMQWPIDQAGNTVSLGTLRRAVVPSNQYQQLQSQSQERYQALMREKAALDRQLVERLSTEPAPTRGTPASPGTSLDDLYSADPVLSGLWSQTKSTADAVTQFTKGLDELKSLYTSLAQGLSQIPVVLKTQQIQAQDPSVNPQKLFESATALSQRAAVPGGILEDAYRLLTYDQKLAAAKADGERAGREQAEQAWAAQQALAPFQPNGSGAMVVAPAPPTFTNEQDLMTAVLRDPDIHRVWTGQLDTLPPGA